MNNKKIWALTPKQAEYAQAVFSGEYRYLLFGGAVRGGKTACMLLLIMALCRIYPGSRWAIVRKDLPSLKKTAIPSFKKFRYDFFSKINQSTWTSTAKNGSEIIFFPESYNQDKDLERFNGLEVNGFAFEEANEMNEKTFDKCLARAGAHIIPNTDNQPLPYILLTCNPSDGWVKKVFYLPFEDNTLKPPYYYLPSYIQDNPHLPQSYLDGLKELEKKNPEVYRRFVKGSWEGVEDPFALIKYDWLHGAVHNTEDTPGDTYMGVDPSRYGDDKTVWAIRKGTRLIHLSSEEKTSITDIVKRTKILAHEYSVNGDRIHVDGVGIGAGVVDGLREDGFDVVDLQSGGRPIEREDSVYTYNNLRSQINWEFRELLREGIVSFDIEDQTLFSDLTALRYEIKSDKMIAVESKDKIKNRIGRSTDYGDAVVYCYFQPEQDDFIFV